MSFPLQWNKSVHEGKNYISFELLQTHFEQFGFISNFITHLQSVMNKGGRQLEATELVLDTSQDGDTGLSNMENP